MHSRNSIGKLVSVFPNKIIVELKESLLFNSNFHGVSYSLHGIGDYIVIQNDNNLKTLYMVSNLYQKEKPLSNETNSKFSNITFMESIPLGEWNNNKFQFGITKYPMVGKNVYIAINEEIKSIFFEKKEENSIELGEIINANNLKAAFSIDTLFSCHTAVLGNSGSGKSTTIRKMLSKIVEMVENKAFYNTNINLVIFDVHNEYMNFQKKYTTYLNVPQDIAIPINLLVISDWISLLMPSAGVQLPVLKIALRLGNICENKEGVKDKIIASLIYQTYYYTNEVIAKRTKILALVNRLSDDKRQIFEEFSKYYSKFGNFESIQHEQNFLNELVNIKSNINIDKLIEQSSESISNISSLEIGLDFAFLLEESKGNNQIRSNCMALLTRVKTLISDYSSNLFCTDPNKISNFLSLFNFSNPILVVDVSTLNAEDLNFFVSLYMNLLYSLQKGKGAMSKKIYNIILDEAHRYIRNNPEADRTFDKYNMFEKIAKEGRKFDIFMLISSQRPSEISKTVLSQCNNFIMHRIRNDLDLEHIKKSNPFINENLISRLSILPTGTALMVGDAFNIPIEVRINAKDNDMKDSNNSVPSAKWFNK